MSRLWPQPPRRRRDDRRGGHRSVRRHRRLQALYLLLNALWSWIACAAFAFLNNGGPVEVVGVLVGASPGKQGAAPGAAAPGGYNQFGVVMLAGPRSGLSRTWLGYRAARGSARSASGTRRAMPRGAVHPRVRARHGALDLAEADFSRASRGSHTLHDPRPPRLRGPSSVVGLQPRPAAAAWPDTPLLLTSVRRVVPGVLGFVRQFTSLRPMVVGAATVGMVANVVRFRVRRRGRRGAGRRRARRAAGGPPRGRRTAPARPTRITISVPAVVIMVPGRRPTGRSSTCPTGRRPPRSRTASRPRSSSSPCPSGLAVARMATDRALGSSSADASGRASTTPATVRRAWQLLVRDAVVVPWVGLRDVPRCGRYVSNHACAWPRSRSPRSSARCPGRRACRPRQARVRGA